MLAHVVPFVTVFARMSPQQKGFIIRETKAQGTHCLMCGDGTNDVAALKQAHVGVSIMSNTALEEKIAQAEKLFDQKVGVSELFDMKENEEEKSPLLNVGVGSGG